MWRFFKDFFIYGIASVLGKIAAVLLMPVYTSILTKEEYGTMALIIACKGIIDLVYILNLHTAGSRDYYEKDISRKKLVSTGFFSILTMSAAVMAALLLSRRFWMEDVIGIDMRFESAFIFMLLSVPAGSLMSYFAILTRFRKKPVLYAAGTLLQLFIQIGISVAGVVWLRRGIESIFFGVLAGEIVAVLIFAFINRSDIGFTWSGKYLRRLLLFAVPTLPAILAGWLDNSVGQFLIKKFISVEDLGVYSIALSISSAFALVSVAFNNVWSPFLFENYDKPGFRKTTGDLYSILMLAMLSLTSLVSLFSREIVLLLSNPGYLDAARYLILLCFPMCVYILFPVASSGVSVSRDTKYIGIAYMLGSAFNLAAMFLTIRRWGIISVPLCLGLSRIITYFFLYLISEKTIHLRLPQKYILALLVSVALYYFLAAAGTALWIRALLAVSLNAAIFVALRNKVDFSTLKAHLIKNKEQA